jgi:hypothetical protein
MYLQLCGKEPEIENARMLLHFTILQANIIGAPKGKALAKGSFANLQNHDANTPTQVEPALVMQLHLSQIRW